MHYTAFRDAASAAGSSALKAACKRRPFHPLAARLH
jgi:hypothetical protein